jgi:hypothetical protein
MSWIPSNWLKEMRCEPTVFGSGRAMLRIWDALVNPKVTGFVADI